MSQQIKRFWFGRGSSDCIYVEMQPGHRAKIGVGNGKCQEVLPGLVIMEGELHDLADFFMALWQDHGMSMFTGKFVDDPCDNILMHDFDFSQFDLVE